MTDIPLYSLRDPVPFQKPTMIGEWNTSSPDSNGSCRLWGLVNIALNLSNWCATSSVRVSFPYAVRTSKKEHWAIMAYGNYSTLVTKRKTHTQKPETENRTKNVFRGHIPVVRKTHNYDSLNYKQSIWGHEATSFPEPHPWLYGEDLEKRLIKRASIWREEVFGVYIRENFSTSLANCLVWEESSSSR